MTRMKEKMARYATALSAKTRTSNLSPSIRCRAWFEPNGLWTERPASTTTSWWRPTTAVVKVGITLLDLNDNPPYFANDTLVYNLPENLPSGSKVGTIYVKDPDIGANSEVRFKLLNTTADAQYFFIDDSSSSGSTVLYTRKEFDYEVDRRDYNLLLRAESEPLRTDVVVIVQLAGE